MLRFLMLVLLGAMAHAETPAKPNIIVIMTDDQGFPPLGRHGHPWLRTPNLDTLHDTSTRFTRFFASPTCSPTRSALMTGRHPLKNGITHTIRERERLTLQAVTLPQVLQPVGYTSGIFGKWHLGDEEAYQPRNRGFDEEFIHGAGGIGQVYPGSCADVPKNRYLDPVIRHNGIFKQTHGFCTDVFFRAALDWIHRRSSAKQPFFAYITPNAAHSPFIAPKKNAQRFRALGFAEDTAGYYGMIENIDENIGLLLDRLKEWKLLENTVVIFLSDNGMTGGGSGRPGKPLAEGHPFYNAGMKGLKGSVDEGGVRVPFFLRWDGHFPAGRDIDRIAAHIDLLPTLAALTGARLPKDQVEGRNLLPLLAGEGKDWPDRMLFDHTGRWEQGENPDDHQWKNFTVRNQKFRLVGRDALYDMEKDPGQTTNVADQHPDVVQTMLAAYASFWKEARPLMINEGVELAKSRPFHTDFLKQQQEKGIPEWKPSLPGSLH
jgi:arylsulfatase